MPNLPSELTYCSLLSYASHPVTDEQKRSRGVAFDLKQNRQYSAGGICDIVAKRVLEQIAHFPDIFGSDVIAIPIPSSAMKKPGSLHVPSELTFALKRARLVGEVEDIVTRVRSLPKSATSDPQERSTALSHFGSVEIAKPLIPSTSTLLLVDDVITRGATLMGIAWKIREAFPEANIYAFAAMRAISDPSEFIGILDPIVGKITMRGRYTQRRP